MIPPGIMAGSMRPVIPILQINHSVRLEAANSARLVRTLGVPTDGRKFTAVIRAKRGTLSTSPQQVLWAGSDGPASSTYSQLFFNVSNELRFLEVGSGSTICEVVVSSGVFKDPTAFYDIQIVADSTESVADDRVKISVNGVVQPTTVLTPKTLNSNFLMTQNGYVSAIGAVVRSGSSSAFFDGLIADCYLVDGQALLPTAFGRFLPGGVWVPREYTGTYGAQGTHLDFSNASSLATLFADKSGNLNDYTSTGVSLTAGVDYDVLLDTPTKNKSVFSPINTKVYLLTEVNYKGTQQDGSDPKFIKSSISVGSGKWYFETFHGSSASSIEWTGIGSQFSSSVGGGVPTAETILYARNGQKWVNGVNTAYGASWTPGTDTIGVAVDLDSNEITFYKNNVSQGVIAVPSGHLWTFFTLLNSSSPQATIWPNFGQRAFTYSPPSGFQAISTEFMTPTAVLTSGTFTGNANADGPVVWTHGSLETLTINGNAVTWGTHADRLAGGFKIRTSSASYNAAGANTWTATAGQPFTGPNPAQIT